mgnify:CR=1 FL=1
MDFFEIIKKAVDKGTSHARYEELVKLSKFNKSLYTGKDQEEILLSYRTKESDNQKKQRIRITKTRTKHVCGKLENVLDQLHGIDKPQVSYIGGNDNQKEVISEYVYENNLEQMAFESVKYANITDSNSFMVCGVDDWENITFVAVGAENVFDYKIINKNLIYLITKHERKYQNQTVNDYRLYSKNLYILLEDARGSGIESETITLNNYTYKHQSTETKLNYAFRLGYKLDASTNFETCVPITDKASELFVQLIFDGSEMDTIKATHGVLRTWAIAPKCSHSQPGENGHETCIDGKLYCNNEASGVCPACKGSGLKIHSSSQDIIYLPEPSTPDQFLPLDKMVYTQSIPDSHMKMRKEDLKELEDTIIRTVFNANNTTQDEVQSTATEKLIDERGVYATLGNLANHVSECFIWMVECVMDIKGIEGVKVDHGYQLDLNIETLMTLIDQRTKAGASGAPTEVVDVYDYAILKKQHLGNPYFMDRFSIWEMFRPFSDKTDAEKQTILSLLPKYDRSRILYIFFATIKKEIIATVGDVFFEMEYKKQKEIINEKVDEIIKEMKESEPEIPPIHIDFENL